MDSFVSVLADCLCSWQIVCWPLADTSECLPSVCMINKAKAFPSGGIVRMTHEPKLYHSYVVLMMMMMMMMMMMAFIILALFSALQQPHCAFVSCDSKWVTVAFYSTFWIYPQKWCTYSAVRLLHGKLVVFVHSSAMLSHVSATRCRGRVRLIACWLDRGTSVNKPSSCRGFVEIVYWGWNIAHALFLKVA